MITIKIFQDGDLNVSLQVGDMMYATPTKTQDGSSDAENLNGPLGAAKLVGILIDINKLSKGTFLLTIDNSSFTSPYIPLQSDFLMFSKYSQTDGDVAGYYAKAKFVNDSTKKAELFAVSSEIVINSK
tara:strand:- start:115 stop:498 length:384 start_codon:yes stop_codon:yes gene_type:complete